MHKQAIPHAHRCPHRYSEESGVIWREKPQLCNCCHGDTVCSSHSHGAVTTHPKPHLYPKQTSIFPLLLFYFLSLPSPCVNLFLHPYRSLHLPLPSPSPTSLFSRLISHSQCQIIGYSVQLTNMEWEDRRSLADNHTLSLSCFSPC